VLATLERLARADAFASLGLSRRQAYGRCARLAPEQKAAALPLFDGQGVRNAVAEDEASADLPALPPGMEVLGGLCQFALVAEKSSAGVFTAGLRRACAAASRLAKCRFWAAHERGRSGDLSAAPGQCQRALFS
jgi:hypothetical protein